MNYLKKTASILLGLGLSLIPLNSSAQTPAGSGSFPASSSAGVQNVGNYIQGYTGGGDLMVFVQDGTTPLLWWRDAASGTMGTFPLLAAGAVDPDVAVSLSFGPRVATVVYQIGTNIYFESHVLNAGVWSPVVGPTLVSSGSPASRPNTDGGFYGIFVWEEVAGGVTQIFTRDINPVSGAMGPIINLSAAAGFAGINCREPDVATYKGPSSPVYHYSYVVDGGSSQRVYHHMEKAGNIAAGTPAVSYLNVAQSVSTSSAQLYHPRIAAQHHNMGVPEQDAAAITYLWYENTGRYHMMVYTAPGGTNDVTAPATFFNCGNKNPKISWSQACGEYVVIWDHAGGPCGSGALGIDVLSIKTDALGNPTTFYQWVNNPTLGGQYAGAISSRFAFGPSDLFTNYIDLAAGAVMVKQTNCGLTPYMREAASISEEIAVYPNPAKDFFTVEADDLKSIRIYSLNGQLVQATTVNDSRQVQIDISELSSGLYLVDIETATGRQKTKIAVE